MKVDILDINKFIKENNCKEVTNPVHFNMGSIPTENGLFSYTIFGAVGSKQRKNTFAYINLNGKFLHPVMFKMLTRMDKRVLAIVNGTEYFKIVNGELVKDSENGETGVSFLYKNFEKIKFKDTGSSARSEKLLLLNKLNKDEVFIDKFIVIPASLRDFNPSKIKNDKIDAVDKVNDIYSRIIRTAQSLDGGLGFDFMGSNAEATIQNALVEIYTMFTGYLAKKTGMFHQSLLGKTIDYATRSVISAPRLKTNSWDENTIRFGYTGIPLTQICVLFYPFFVKYITDFFEERADELSTITDKKGNIIHIKNVMEQFSEDKIKKMIELFIKSPESRFNSLKIKDENGKEYPLEIFNEDLGRNFTIMDLLYIVAVDVCSDKHVYITRYPIEHYQGVYPSKITVVTTHDTKEQKIEDRYLKDYPVIYPDYPVEQDFFIDTTIPNNSYLGALGGDYDGDMLSLRAVFSVEANQEADKLIKSKTNFLYQNGSFSRSLGNEGVQALYSLTRD